MDKKGWVDIPKAKTISFDVVIDAIGLREQLTRSGAELRGTCPIPAHTGSKEQDKFFINVGKGVFKCHQCKKGGNVLDFAMAYHGKAVKEAAAWLIALEPNGQQPSSEGETTTGAAEREKPATLLSDFDKVLLCGFMSVVRPQLEELFTHAENPEGMAGVLCGVLNDIAGKLGETAAS